MLLIVTRPPAQAADWVQQLQALGQRAAALPLIAIEPVADRAPLHAAWQGLAQCDLVMFVSANAVLRFFADAPPGTAWPPGLPAASTGPGTSAALRACGVPPALLREPPPDAAQFDSEALWAQLAGQHWHGRRALIVRGEDGRDWLAETLQAHGAQVDFVAAYRRCPPRPDAVQTALLQRALVAPADHLWLFSSSQAVAHLQALAGGGTGAWQAARAVASHPRIALAARAAGFGSVQLAAPSPAAVAALARQWPSIESAAS